MGIGLFPLGKRHDTPRGRKAERRRFATAKQADEGIDEEKR
jgi:hypothetical protein